mmetsp:Transcript_26402/g.55325  ORF Transcript_26402/g.55325 Transcript_26402/m.55325 type:complete len:82 (-) Transcript_26402:42-287(-)
MERSWFNRVDDEIFDVLVRKTTRMLFLCNLRHASMAPGMTVFPMWSVPDRSIRAALNLVIVFEFERRRHYIYYFFELLQLS